MAIKTIVTRCRALALLLIIVLCANNAPAQNYVTLPDTGFVNWLTANYGSCMNGVQLDTTCSAILTQTYVDVSYVSIANLTGIQYFKNLDSLRCNVDSILTYIPSIPPHVVLFECRNNLLDSLPALPDSLVSFSCESNNLTRLPALPPTLQFLACYNNLLDSLPGLPAGLLQLYCSGNLIDSLPAALPDSLITLWCYGNKLSKLPSLPVNLNSLLCSQNLLHSLPALPDALRQLDCYSNLLTSLPTLPDSLNSLECHHNKLGSLPVLPATLSTLNCEYNNLTSLPELPDSMFQLYIDNNPDLACLPVMQTIEYLEFFNDPRLACVPTYGNVVNSDPPLNSLPICDSTNTTSCTIISNIQKLNTSELRIFPNPAKDEVTITASADAVGSSIMVYDLTGRELLSAKLESATTQLNTSNLTPGMYLLQITGVGNSNAAFKLVVEE